MLEQLLKDQTGREIISAVVKEIENKKRARIAVHGPEGSAFTFFSAALALRCRRPLLVITADTARAEKVYSDLEAFFPGQASLVPPREFFMSPEVISRSEDYQQLRLQFMERLYRRENGFFVSTGAAFLSRAIPPETWNSLVLDLRAGYRLDRQELIEKLVERGYERVFLAESAGHFSARGNLIDIYSPGGGDPCRLELIDDRLDSLRLFDPQTQRSREKVERVVIIPARELFLTAHNFRQGEILLKSNFEKALAALNRRGEKEAAVRLKQQVERHLERLALPEGLDMLDSYFSFFYGKGASLADYLPGNFLVVVEEPAAVGQKGENLRRDVDDYFSSAVISGDLLSPPEKILWSEKEVLDRLNCPLVGCSLFPAGGSAFMAGASFSLETKNVPYYHGQWDLFKNDLSAWARDGYNIFLTAATEQRARGLKDLLARQFNSGEEKSPAGPGQGPALPQALAAALDGGFVIPDFKLALISEQNLLPRRHKKKRLARKAGALSGDYRDLATGDYVVHEEHGIGRYQGISTLEIGGVKRDYLLLKYKGTDKLYIPVDQAALIRKYSGGEGPPPRLHSLGGGEWQRLKTRVSRSVEELARELLALYAARQAVKGYRFGADHPWQQEFEAQFPFEETPDQLRAIGDVKADLEKSHPMDRLICGDVGYGKTEVAMRAAFKAVMEGKQVAVLVPTTILAQQHFRTFSERFEGFPVRVAQLSRFLSAAGQKEIIKGIAAGKIDIVIGTHRILSADVEFCDLGLLVIDEEHRFGVRQKEKMKQMRLDVDTLAMTATPIPRTLHLSLAGSRDLSLIDTPPEDRYPIQTYILEYSDNLVREAVQRELNRQGQVFIVFNRIDRINAYAGRIQKLFPQVALAVGHGRMPESTLERVMSDFQDGSYRILVSTTIIESGLDIANVNTLIVCDADKFGLAQLYQLRGRVGRSSRLAYAYLTYRRDKVVSETARKRLQAIREFTELGSGFKIALQDLEIRGAGNILGAEQHGFIAAVGYDLYCKLLDRAVSELKNEKREEQIDPRLDLRLDAFLPSAYINGQSLKVELYQRIYNAARIGDLTELSEEMTDRFGSPPGPVRNLLAVAELRILARDLGVEHIHQQKEMLVRFRPGINLSEAQRQKIDALGANRVVITNRHPLTLSVCPLHGLETGPGELLSFFKELRAVAVDTSGKL